MLLISLNELRKYEIQGKEDILGDVNGFLFDITTWKVKHLRVKYGIWPFKKEFVIPMDCIGAPDNVEKVIPTDLLEKDLEHLPSTNWLRTQIGNAFEKINHHWRIGNFRRSFAWRLPFAISSIFNYYQEEPKIPQAEHSIHPQLRSLMEFEDYRVDARDGDIGEVQDLFIDADRWKIRYVMVHGPQNTIMLPSQWIRQVNPTHETLKLDLNRESVLDGPYVIG
jgi:sporulation protein YlmC with PRC-barrel domain